MQIRDTQNVINMIVCNQ